MQTSRETAGAAGETNGRSPFAGPVVVVGYDGSDTSKAALAYAARRVGGRGRLLVVHSYRPLSSWFGTPSYHQDSDRRQPPSTSVLDAIEPELLGDVRHERRLVSGPPARALVEAARESGATEIVAGTRRFGLIRSGLGSVSRALLQEADRPVTIVPPGYDPDDSPRPGNADRDRALRG